MVGVRNERPIDLPKISGRASNKPSDLVEYPQHFYDVYPVYTRYERLEGAKALMAARQKDVDRAYEHIERAFIDEDNGTLNDAKDNSRDQQETHEVIMVRSSSQAGQKNETAYGSPTKVPPPKSAIEALFRGNFAAKIAAERSAAMQLFTTPPTRNRPQHPLSPAVNRETGVGLREFLTKKAQEGSVRKRDCSSITFCDFSPHIITGEFKNKLLGHWTATREKGERIEVYEVDL